MSLAALIHRSRMGRKEQAAAGTLIYSYHFADSDFNHMRPTAFDSSSKTFTVDDASWLSGSKNVRFLPNPDETAVSVGLYEIGSTTSNVTYVDNTHVSTTFNVSGEAARLANTLIKETKSHNIDVVVPTELTEFRLDIDGYFQMTSNRQTVSFIFNDFTSSTLATTQQVSVSANANNYYKGRISTYFSLRKEGNTMYLSVHRSVGTVYIAKGYFNSYQVVDFDYSGEEEASGGVQNGRSPKINIGYIFGDCDIKLYQL